MPHFPDDKQSPTIPIPYLPCQPLQPLPTVASLMWRTIFSHPDSLPANALAQPLPFASHFQIVNLCSRPRSTVVLNSGHLTAQMLKHMFCIMTQFQSTGKSHSTVYLTFTNYRILFQDLSCDCHMNWDYEANYTDGSVNICFALHQNYHKMVWENLFSMPKRFKIGDSVNPNLCQLLLNTQMEFETNPCDICQTLDVSDKPKHLKLDRMYHGLHQKGFLVCWKVHFARSGVNLLTGNRQCVDWTSCCQQ